MMTLQLIYNDMLAHVLLLGTIFCIYHVYLKLESLTQLPASNDKEHDIYEECTCHILNYPINQSSSIYQSINLCDV